MSKILYLFLVVLISCQGSVGQDKSDKVSQEVYLADDSSVESKLSVAYLASGCFWCTEAQFERIQGVEDVASGYSGGVKDNPTYREVANGRTQYAEAVRVVYDPMVVSYETLLDVFFVGHDPTTLNRQGPDVGAHYRSAIFYKTDAERTAALSKIKKLDESGKLKNKVVTEVTAFTGFYFAEEYHQDYYELHPKQPYIYSVSRPKVEKVVEVFKDILKPKYAS